MGLKALVLKSDSEEPSEGSPPQKNGGVEPVCPEGEVWGLCSLPQGEGPGQNPSALTDVPAWHCPSLLYPPVIPLIPLLGALASLQGPEERTRKKEVFKGRERKRRAGGGGGRGSKNRHSPLQWKLCQEANN